MNRLVAILISVLCVVIIYQYIDNQRLQGEVEKGKDFESLYGASVKKNKIWKDEANLWRNEAGVAKANESTLKELAKQGDPRITKILAEFSSIKKNFKNLESYTELQAQSISEIKGAVKDSSYRIVKGKDTVEVFAKKITAKNEWNNYDITIVGDSADIRREGREEFDMAVYWERLTKKGNKTIWPFGKKEWSSEVVSKNPETKISKQNSLLVGKKVKIINMFNNNL